MGRIPVLCTKKKMLQKILKKPSKTKQRNPCHKLHPPMSKIPTGDLLLDLFSKASVKVRTSLTQNQTLDFRTNMGLFCSTETSRNAKGLVKNSLLLAKSVFMARFRHSMAWTEEFEATQKNTGKSQPRLLINTENGKEVEGWPSSARSGAMSQGGLQRCSAAGQGSSALCTEALGRTLWTPEAELDQPQGNTRDARRRSSWDISPWARLQVQASPNPSDLHVILCSSGFAPPSWHQPCWAYWVSSYKLLNISYTENQCEGGGYPARLGHVICRRKRFVMCTHSSTRGFLRCPHNGANPKS